MSTTDEFKVLDLAAIMPSPLNPRKRFDPHALEELSLSIKKYGVLQAILVRRTATGTGYELVYGERRYRASKMAGRETIKAEVRSLTDDEAFEIQIIENLERKDIHPLEEAEAYQRMLDSDRYTLPDIAAKFAKPETFIVQRLKLNDLAEELKQDFFEGDMSIGHAVLIARLPEAQQLELLSGYKNKDKIDGYGTVNQLKQEIEHDSLDLTQAAFSLEQDYDCAKACSGCMKRTIINPLLFHDMQDADSCMDKSCYRQKTDAHIMQEVLDIIEYGKDIILASGHSSKPAENVLAVAKKFNLDILVEFEGFYTAERFGSMQKAIFYISGPNKGAHAKAWVPNKVKPETGSAPLAPVSSFQISEVQKLRDKEKKFEELDQQKVYGQYHEALKKDFARKKELPFIFDGKFITAMFTYMAMAVSDMWQLLNDLKEYGYNLNFDHKNLQEVVDQLAALTPQQHEQILALALFRKFSQNTNPTGIHGQIIRELAMAHPHILVTKMEDAQADIASQRKVDMVRKIEELEKPKAKKKGQSTVDHAADAMAFGIDVHGIRDIRDMEVVQTDKDNI